MKQMGIVGTVLVAALALFLTWSVALVSTVWWLSSRFGALEKYINKHVPTTEYFQAHSILMMRVAALERWALRLNGSVKVNFAETSNPDYRAIQRRDDA